MKEANPMELTLKPTPVTHHFFFPCPFMKSAKPTEKWAPETLLLKPIPDIQNQLRKLQEAKPMEKLAPETHSHAHPRHAKNNNNKNSLGN